VGRYLVVVATLTAVAAVTIPAVASAGDVIAPTPWAAALAAAKQFAAHDVRVHPNYPLTYKLGACRRLFSQPWVAWRCTYALEGYGPNEPYECDSLTVAVKRLSDGTYRGREVGLRTETSRSPCRT
jgi:hypothetical protein